MLSGTRPYENLVAANLPGHSPAVSVRRHELQRLLPVGRPDPMTILQQTVLRSTKMLQELKGHQPKSPSTLFDEEFSQQVFVAGKMQLAQLGDFCCASRPLRVKAG